jgi:hypothetical protein
MKVIHYLSSVDLTNGTGTFMYRTDKCTEWVKSDVSLSRLIMWRIENRATNKREKLPINVNYVGHVFTSELTSDKYEDSPFKLVYFEPGKDSDIPPSFKLECVDEHSEPIIDVILNKVIGYKDGIIKASNYMRYVHRKTNKMLADITATIVPMNIERIPVIH